MASFNINTAILRRRESGSILTKSKQQILLYCLCLGVILLTENCESLRDSLSHFINTKNNTNLLPSSSSQSLSSSFSINHLSKEQQPQQTQEKKTKDKKLDTMISLQHSNSSLSLSTKLNSIIWFKRQLRHDKKVGNSVNETRFSDKQVLFRNSRDVSANTEEIEENFDGHNDRFRLEEKFKLSHPVELWTSLGFYDDAYLSMINSHWLQFDAADPTVHKILALCYTFICICGCSGNLLVIVMCIRCPSLRNPPIYLVMNLAVSDFLMMAKMPIFIYNSYYQGPALGAIGCQIYGFVGGLSGTCSIMTLAAISLDRYYVIAYPFNPLRWTSSSRAFYMMGFVWLYSTLFSSLPLFGRINAYVSEGYLTSCSFEYLSPDLSDRIFILVFFLAAYVLPLIAIVFSYVNIFFIVRSAERLQFSGASCSGESFKCRRDAKKTQKAEVKIAKLSFIIILVWSLAWTPYAIVALLGITGYHSAITPLISAIPALFCKTASCIDPFIYAINHPKFQRELRNTFSCCNSTCSRIARVRRRRGRGSSTWDDATQENNAGTELGTFVERTTSIKKSIKRNTVTKMLPGSGMQLETRNEENPNRMLANINIGAETEMPSTSNQCCTTTFSTNEHDIT